MRWIQVQWEMVITFFLFLQVIKPTFWSVVLLAFPLTYLNKNQNQKLSKKLKELPTLHMRKESHSREELLRVGKKKPQGQQWWLLLSLGVILFPYKPLKKFLLTPLNYHTIPLTWKIVFISFFSPLNLLKDMNGADWVTVESFQRNHSKIKG